MSLSPKDKISLNEDRLDASAEDFADVIDAKSRWTSRHSYGVAVAMIRILQELRYDEQRNRYWRRAALLNDLGKLGVSNHTLNKPGRLTDEEFESVKRHVNHKRRILKHVLCFVSFADDPAAHHEKPDSPQ
ncbi:MAG: HD domain-containing phosphohydrolase [Planctomycetota bacterium]|nr:HD domain-containing phosphohydrolase [Planctomycetota bacterium]